MDGHKHEPDPERTKSMKGYPADPLDRAAYPMLSTCEGCGRRIRCNEPDAPWQNPEEYAGIPIDWGGTKGVPGGGTVIMPYTQSNSGPWRGRSHELAEG